MFVLDNGTLFETRGQLNGISHKKLGEWSWTQAVRNFGGSAVPKTERTSPILSLDEVDIDSTQNDEDER